MGDLHPHEPRVLGGEGKHVLHDGAVLPTHKQGHNSNIRLPQTATEKMKQNYTIQKFYGIFVKKTLPEDKKKGYF